MKRLIVVLLALCLFAAAPAQAADKLTDIFGSFSYQKGDATGQTRDLGFELNFGVTGILSFGALLEYTYFKPPADAASTEILDAWSMGGQVVLHMNKAHNGLVGGLAVLVPNGDADGTVVKPWVGFEYGAKNAVFRVTWQHPYNYGFDGGDAIDLERNIVTAAIGFRFK